MNFTNEELDSLDAFVKSSSPPSVEGGGSLMGRAGEHLANLPMNILQSLVHSGEAIGELGVPQPEERWKAPNFFDVAPPTTTGEMVTDVIGQHLAPELLASLLPFGAASGLVKGRRAVEEISAARELAASIAGNVAAGAFTGIKEGPEQALHYGIAGGALAGIAPLSLAKQFMTGGLIAGADAAVTYGETGDPRAAMIAGGTDIGLGVLPGLFNLFKPGVEEATAVARDRRAPRLGYPEIGPQVYPAGYTPRLGLPPHAEPISGEWFTASGEPIIQGDTPRAQLGYPEGQMELPSSERLALEGTEPLSLTYPGGPYHQNAFRSNEEADIHIPENFYPMGDIIDPSFQAKPEVDEFFRLIHPIITPHEVQAYQPGQELIVQPNIGSRRPQPVPIPSEKVKEISTKLNEKIFEMEQDARFAAEEGDHDTANSLRRVITHMRNGKRSMDEHGFIDMSVLNYIGQTLAGAAIGGLQGDTKEEHIAGAAAGALAGLGMAHLTNGGLKLNRFKSPGSPLDEIISSGKVVYDGENDVLGQKLHQFTIEDPSLQSHGATFQVKGEVTPAAFLDSYNNTRTRFGDAAVGQATEMARKFRGAEEGAITIGKQPFRTAFEDRAEVGPEGKVRRIGSTDVAQDGFMNLTRFKKASQIQDDELAAYRLAFPEAFVGDEINVNQLKAGLEQKELVHIENLSHIGGEAGELFKAKAALQHALDTHHPKLIINSDGNLVTRSGSTQIDFESLHPEVKENYDKFADASGELADLDSESARAASARYEQYELNPRPLAELQQKGGMDQLVQAPTRENPLSKVQPLNQLHESSHFEGADATNILNFTRGYVDQIPGKGKAEIIYESQGDWAQERRKYFKENPLATKLEDIPSEQNAYQLPRPGITRENAKAWWGDKAVENYNKGILDQAPKEHPLLNQYKRLGLKARVQKALNEGQDGVFIHDAETVTLTEGHDKMAGIVEEVKPSEINKLDNGGIYTSRGGAGVKPVDPTGKYVAVKSVVYRIDKPLDNPSANIKIAEELSHLYDGGKTLPREGEFYIPQLKGMRKNYNEDYVNILTELTGAKPEHISMGEGTHRAYPGKTNDKGQYVIEGSDKGSKALGGKSDISGWWFDLKPLKEKQAKVGGMRNRMSLMGTRGIILPHYASTLFGATGGGLWGYAESGGDTNVALAWAVAGGAAGYLGHKGLEALLRSSSGGLAPKVKSKAGIDLNRIKSESVEAAKEIFTKPSRDIAGQDVFGRGGVMSKFIKGLEFWNRLHLPEEIKTAWTQARGTGVLAVQTVLNALDVIKGTEVPESIRNAASQFMDGKFLPEADTIRMILKGGGVTRDVWDKIEAKSRPTNFSMWKVGTGPTEKIFYVPKTTKNQLITAEENAFKSILGSDHEAYFEFVRTGRRATDNLQALWAEGMPDGRLKSMIENSIGQYIPRTYRIFTDPGYRPTEVQVQAAMDELRDHLVNKDIKFTDAPDSYFRREVANYLHELKTGKELFGIGTDRKTIDTTLLKEREDISPTFRELLGEYTDPKDRIIQAISRLYPSAQAARFISLARHTHNKLDGLQASMTKNEYLTTLKKLDADLNRIKSIGTDPAAIAALEAKQRRLSEYVELPNSVKYGDFKGVLANRFIADQLRGFDGHFQGWDSPMFRSFARVNNWSKIIHTAYSPATVARQYITMPVFMAIGKATPESAKQAWQILRSKSGPMYEELIETGVWTADQVAGEFRLKFEDIFSGHYDSSIVSKMKKIHKNILEFYRFPDALVRAATYIEAKSRYSAEMKLSIDHPEVKRAAITWTDRRTMNYDNIAPFIQVARNLPFFNQYISYSAEMIRLTKNLVVDGAKGDLSALATLGLLAGAGEAIQLGAEAALSPEDKKQWTKANEFAPDYSRTRYKVPLSKDANGNFRYMDITPFMVTDNLNQMLRAALRGDTQALAAVNPLMGWQETPVIKIMTQAVAGRDIQTQKTFRGANDYGMMIAKELSPSWTPGIGYEWEKAASIGTTNVKTGRSESWTGVLARNLAGLNLTSVNPSLVEKSAMARMKQEIANERAYLNEVIKMKGVSPEKLHRTVDRYQQSVRAIIADYRQKTQGDSQ